MNKIRVFIVSICLSALGLSVQAQSTKLQATVNKNPIATGERLVVSFELSNATGSNFQPPSFNDFKLLGGPNQSSSFQFINGRTTSTQSFSYILMPFKEGEYTIGPASIVADGKKISSEPINIKVTKGSAVPPPSNPGVGAGADQEPKAEKANGNVFVKLFIDRSKVYKGEQITATYKIYTKANIVDFDVSAAPAFNGFWSKNIDLGQVSLKPENVNGTTYYAATLQKNILFPQRSGKLSIDPLKLEVVLRMKEQGNPHDVFDQFFGRYKDVKYTIESNSAPIEVLALPEASKPNSFQGAVGNFSISVDCSKKKLKANDALNLKIRMSGEGNIHLVDFTKPDFPIDFEQYDPKISDQTSLSSGKMSGKKEWDYLLIPRSGGSFTLGPFYFSYFDPVKKKYVEIVKEAIQIEVQKDSSEQNAQSYAPSVQQKEVQTLDKDIRFIKTNLSSFQLKQDYFFGSFAHILFLLLPCLVFAFVWYTKSSRDKLRANVGLYRKSKANKVALARMMSAKNAMDANNDLFYEEMYKGVLGYISDTFTIETSDLNQERIQWHLRNASISDEMVQEAMQLVSYVEMARFSPVQELSKPALYQKSIDFIEKMERTKSKKA